MASKKSLVQWLSATCVTTSSSASAKAPMVSIQARPACGPHQKPFESCATDRNTLNIDIGAPHHLRVLDMAPIRAPPLSVDSCVVEHSRNNTRLPGHTLCLLR